MMTALHHLDLDTVYIHWLLVVQLLIHEKFALEVSRYIERPDVQLDSTARLVQGSKWRW